MAFYPRHCETWRSQVVAIHFKVAGLCEIVGIFKDSAFSKNICVDSTDFVFAVILRLYRLPRGFQPLAMTILWRISTDCKDERRADSPAKSCRLLAKTKMARFYANL